MMYMYCFLWYISKIVPSMDVGSYMFSLLRYFGIPKKDSDETGTMHKLTWAFAAVLYNKHQTLICCLNYL